MKKPDKPQEMNGNAGHLWHFIDYAIEEQNNRMQEQDNRMSRLEKRLNQLFFTIIAGLVGVIGTLVTLGSVFK
ncbi:hypothetical protein LCGC14_1546800 [marine sediment metagenome]|uniref:Uncharacterized protein n=1 Tax=marine sediment metagenome TaxID=412755 RepID=A0A0F9LSA7_9ZZZZ